VERPAAGYGLNVLEVRLGSRTFARLASETFLTVLKKSE
jgi:hypothetical protein